MAWKLKWTVNLKSFEINSNIYSVINEKEMNCKLEKFWNRWKFKILYWKWWWTVNLKSFEMEKEENPGY